VSWGTKGDDKFRLEVDLVVLADTRDIDAAYDEALLILSTKPPKEAPKKDPEDNKD